MASLHRRFFPTPALLPAALLLAGACAAEDPAADAAAARALKETLASTRANLAALGGQAGGADSAAAHHAAAAAPPLRTTATGAAITHRAEPIAATLALPRPARSPGAAPPPAEAAQLMGLAAEAVTHWLGEPALRRPEGPAEIWLYTAASCALDLILYRDGGAAAAAGGRAGTLRVAFAAARATGAERRSEAACLHAIATGDGTGAAPPRAGSSAAAAETGSDASHPAPAAESGGGGAGDGTASARARA